MTAEKLAGRRGFWRGEFQAGDAPKQAAVTHDALMTWNMIQQFLRETTAWGQPYSTMATAVGMCQAALSQQLGVPQRAVCFHIAMPWHVASGEHLTASSQFGLQNLLSGELLHFTVERRKCLLPMHGLLPRGWYQCSSVQAMHETLGRYHQPGGLSRAVNIGHGPCGTLRGFVQIMFGS